MELLATRALGSIEVRTTERFHLLLRWLYGCHHYQDVAEDPDNENLSTCSTYQLGPLFVIDCFHLYNTEMKREA